MNSFILPQSPARFLIPAPAARPSSSFTGHTTRPVTLSARQMLDIELGLFLLSELLPTAPPDALPSLLNGTGTAFANRPTWTPKQHKYLSRGRALLGHFQNRTVWQDLIEQYISVRDHLQQAYDISADRSRFCAKTVGFFRNRVMTFRQTLG